MPDSSGAVDLGNLSTEEQEALAELRQEGAPKEGEAPKVRDVLTAYIVLADPDGSVEVLAFDDDSLNVQHHPNGDLIIATAAKIIRDLEVQEQAHAAAQAFQNLMAQQMMAAREQAQAAQIAQQVQAERGRRG